MCLNVTLYKNCLIYDTFWR